MCCSCFDTTESVCRSPMEQEEMVDISYQSHALVCHLGYIQFSNATLLPCAHDPPPWQRGRVPYPLPSSTREVDLVQQQQQCIMQALTFPTNAFLCSSQDICWPWRVLKQCRFPGPLCGSSSYRKIDARISARFSSRFVLALACVCYVC